MRSDVIVIASVGSQDVAQMRLAQDDKMIHTLAPDRSDQPQFCFCAPKNPALFHLCAQKVPENLDFRGWGLCSFEFCFCASKNPALFHVWAQKVPENLDFRGWGWPVLKKRVRPDGSYVRRREHPYSMTGGF